MAFISSVSTSLISTASRSGSFYGNFVTPLQSTNRHAIVNKNVLPTRSIVMSASPPASSSAAPSTSSGGGPKRTTEADTPQKEFLTRFKQFGKVRLVVRNTIGILEAVGTFDSLFFATIRSGEYANLIEPSNNLDMHLLLSGFTGAKFEIGKSRSKTPAPLYTLRLFAEDKETAALSVFIMWDKDPSDVEQHRIDAWKQLKSDYVKDDSDTFFF